MSKSYHVTRKDLRKLSKGEIDEMEKDPDSLLHQWADKFYSSALRNLASSPPLARVSQNYHLIANKKYT